MTEGNIAGLILQFALPLMLGNVFQMLYNTVDSIVVGNFVGTQALAAVGSTTMITNMAVFFFNGFSVGAGVVIARYFGAGDKKNLPTPNEVMDEATIYLRIYFAGIAGLLIYNMGSGILRAVGDSIRPLFFLILTSVMNIVLDLLFVLGFHMGIAGVAIATIISQFISCVLILMLLVMTKDVYRLEWRELRINRDMLGRIFAIGLPNGIQSVITAFSNVFVQSYINYFGSACMAGWGCYNKIDQFIMLPMSSMAMAATTFVSQNMGAGKIKRENDGTRIAVGITLGITVVIATALWIFAGATVGLFTSDSEVLEFGTMFLRINVYFLLFNCVNHVLAGALRGRGDSTGPMIIMLIGFVLIRQIYLYYVTHFVSNTPAIVGFGYPVGWMSCCVIEVVYFVVRWKRKAS